MCIFFVCPLFTLAQASIHTCSLVYQKTIRWSQFSTSTICVSDWGWRTGTQVIRLGDKLRHFAHHKSARFENTCWALIMKYASSHNTPSYYFSISVDPGLVELLFLFLYVVTLSGFLRVVPTD